MKVGLYSISCSGTWYSDRPAHTVEGFIDVAKKYGYEGVEIDLKRPHGSPLDLDESRCKEIRDYARSQGLPICGAAANNNFASIVPEHIENELLMVREQIRVSQQLGAPVLRVFAAWRGIVKKNGVATYEVPQRCHTYYGALDYELRQAIVACLKECAVWAGKAGVVLALQNHHPIIEDYHDMLDIVRWVDSPWVKCCLDAPCCGWDPVHQSSSYIEQAVKEVGALQMISHANAEFTENPDGSIDVITFDPHIQPVLTNYEAFVKASKAIGYDGFLNYEFCHMPFKDGKVRGYDDYIDNQIRLARIYFKRLIEAA
ncbi:MAG: sugar phosphate isomerase/epimerase [Lachnospiraceae bacterium]|jgi:sugar phosphate isomerase/epimerase|nr:sugar phosphate isomerase/epimerase [Lachnospiraceae bacterium]